jgi:hypothetical protein
VPVRAWRFKSSHPHPHFQPFRCPHGAQTQGRRRRLRTSQQPARIERLRAAHRCQGSGSRPSRSYASRSTACASAPAAPGGLLRAPDLTQRDRPDRAGRLSSRLQDAARVAPLDEQEPRLAVDVGPVAVRGMRPRVRGECRSLAGLPGSGRGGRGNRRRLPECLRRRAPPPRAAARRPPTVVPKQRATRPVTTALARYLRPSAGRASRVVEPVAAWACVEERRAPVKKPAKGPESIPTLAGPFQPGCRHL